MRIIDECSNGKEAINYLEKNSSKIDVILMDITMPEMNGIDATEIVTKLYPEINILALEKAVEKLQKDVERLKDKQREFGNGNGSH